MTPRAGTDCGPGARGAPGAAGEPGIDTSDTSFLDRIERLLDRHPNVPMGPGRIARVLGVPREAVENALVYLLHHGRVRFEKRKRRGNGA